MNKIKTSRLLISLFAIIAICGCGKTTKEHFPRVQPKFAQLQIATEGDTGAQIKSIDITLVLPSGVTVKATSDTINPSVLVTDPGVVDVIRSAAQANASVKGIYTAATSTATGKVKLNVTTTVGSTGFTTGEFAIVNCDVEVGSFPTSADFSVIDFTAVDANGIAINGLTAGFTAII